MMKIRKVLIVDNNITVLKMVESLLLKKEYEVVTALDGLEGLDILEDAERLPDVIILDLIMPKIGGERLTRILRHDTRFESIPIIILTGLASEVEGRIPVPGCDAHIAKGRIEETFKHLMETFRWLEERPEPFEPRENIAGADELHPREMTRELMVMKEHYESVISLMQEGMVELDHQHRILNANPAACRLLARRDHELVGRYFQECFPPGGDLDVCLAALKEKPSATPEPCRLTFEGRELRLHPAVFHSTEVYLGAVVVIEDITSLVRREKELEALMGAIVHNAPVGLCLLDGGGKVLVANPTFAALMSPGPDWNPLGVTLADFLERHCPPLAAAVKEGLGPTHTGKVERTVDYMCDDGGRRQVLNCLFSPLDDEGGRLLILTEDITEKTRSREEKERLQADLHQVQKMDSIGRLAGGVAHDFNNILSSIVGYGELGLEDLGNRKMLRKSLEVILSASDRASSLVRQLLAVSHKQVLDRKALNLNTVIGELMTMLERVLRENITVELKADPQLPPILADKDQVGQILLNLVINAQDAMPSGGTLTISTEAAAATAGEEERSADVPGERFVVLTVADTGAGISPAVREKIFTPFFTTKERGQGTGLGLATVKAILEQHGGRLEVESEPGSGSSFRLYFPVTDEQVEEWPAEDLALRKGTERILLVEDDRFIREMVADALEPLGYQVVLADTGEEALRLCAGEIGDVDLLVTDLVMPGMSGYELVSRFRDLYPRTKVLTMSGYLDREVERERAENAAIPLITKPLSPKRLLKAMRDILDSE